MPGYPEIPGHPEVPLPENSFTRRRDSEKTQQKTGVVVVVYGLRPGGRVVPECPPDLLGDLHPLRVAYGLP